MQGHKERLEAVRVLHLASDEGMRIGVVLFQLSFDHRQIFSLQTAPVNSSRADLLNRYDFASYGDASSAFDKLCAAYSTELGLIQRKDPPPDLPQVFVEDLSSYSGAYLCQVH